MGLLDEMLRAGMRPSVIAGVSYHGPLHVSVFMRIT